MLAHSNDLENFRLQLRDWLQVNVPAGWRDRMTGATDGDFEAFQREWFSTLRSGGWLAPHWPREWGGGGCSIPEQIVIYEEMARVDAPRLGLYFVSLVHLLGTLMEFGTQAQRQRYLPGVIERGEVWAQGFSEPNAGSDLASLKTRAERRGDRYVVNGQKIWSSYAMFARWYLLLVRTDPAAPKHRGITYLLVDLDAPGIERRPIRQLTGEAEFCEVFLTDVEVPVENRVGDENRGWQVTQATLSAERGVGMVEASARLMRVFDQLIADALRAHPGGRLIDDDEVRRELVRLYARTQACVCLVGEQMTRLIHGGSRGAEAAIIKLYYSELLREVGDFGVRLNGLQARYHAPRQMGGGFETGDWMNDYQSHYGWTVAGGTNEVMRNIIGERELGLPREP
ncbi:MAG: acyl-CoA dehydrogenase family protein [Gammaproteobacteria bacterium]